MTKRITSFRISRYILVILAIILCATVLIWLIGRYVTNRPGISDENVIQITNTDPCVQEITNIVSRMWAFDITSVPKKYLDMVSKYANATITERTTGACNNIKFTCKPGQTRIECDPCAFGSARQFAIQQQISDLTATRCNQPNAPTGIR